MAEKLFNPERSCINREHDFEVESGYIYENITPMRKIWLSSSTVFFAAFAILIEAAEIRVAAASDLKFALDELITQFSKEHENIQTKATYGSSGNFYSQLTQRAPFDVFMSADISYPQRLIEAGYALADSKFIYATGHIVIWAPANSSIDPVKLGIESLKHPSVRKIAIANPDHAPYGRAAVAAMRKLGIYDAVKDRLVLGENIAQTAQFIESGAADVGIIALSLALAPAMKKKGRHWEVPLDAYPPLEQAGVIMRWAQDQQAAQDLRAFIINERGQSILKRYGFSAPAVEK